MEKYVGRKYMYRPICPEIYTIQDVGFEVVSLGFRDER